MVDPEEFVQIADHIFNTVVATYAEFGTDLPERRYLAMGGIGTTVHECEQFTVSFEQGYSGIPGSQAEQPAKCSSPRTGVYIVEVVRSIEEPNTSSANPETPVPAMYGQTTTGYQLPRADVQTEVARMQMRDAALLLEAGLRSADATMHGALVDVSAGEPQGAMQAVILTVTSSGMPTYDLGY